MEVDEEQWKITQGSKRQAKWVWSSRTMSGLRLPDTLHAQHQTQRSTRLDWKQTKEYLASPLLKLLDLPDVLAFSLNASESSKH